jgi:hypothetical protein
MHIKSLKKEEVPASLHHIPTKNLISSLINSKDAFNKMLKVSFTIILL